MKTVLVTGAATNTGFGIARRFLKDGWRVGVTSRSEGSAEDAKARLLSDFPEAEVEAFSLNLLDVDTIERAFSEADERLGKLDAFVQNAANMGIGGNLFDLTREDFTNVVSANVCGGFFACREAAKRMRASGGGAIVTLSSITPLDCVYDRTAYIASKGGILAMTRSLALDLGKFGIRVNAVLPGLITTDRYERGTEERKAQWQSVHPLRPSTFEDVANAVYFLASDQAANITGAQIIVDGGNSVFAPSNVF